MTTALEIVHRVRLLGADLLVDGDRLQLDAPSDFPEELIDQIREHKADVLKLVVNQAHEENLQDSDIEELLAWATGLSDRDIVLDDKVAYVEAPLCTVTTSRISFYARTYLRTIAASRVCQTTGIWRPPTPEWWQERETEAVAALIALREALERDEGESSQ